MSIGTFSRPIAELLGLRALLGEPIVELRAEKQISQNAIRAIAGWGFRPSTMSPRALASKHGLPFLALEDGFLRSYGTGRKYPTLSLVVDTEGIYYAADRPSTLESLLASDTDVLSGDGACYAEARQLIVSEALSKYNLAPDINPDSALREGGRILVVDQTVGDASVQYGLASGASFHAMLEAARRENPDATIYIKTHPEVSIKAKRGYLSDVKLDARTVMLRDPINPASILRHMDRVYVVTSHMGFEALLHGVPVTCIGMPWYAGWGSTDDRQHCPRRTRQRSVDELFAAAYLHYTRYLNPGTYDRGTIFDVIRWLSVQRSIHDNCPGRTIAIGYRRWKAENVKPFLGKRVHFVPHAAAAEKLSVGSNDRLVSWGAEPSQAIRSLAQRSGAELAHMEDGFIRSVGLGSDFVPPHSLVIDKRGLYFDARQPNDLEWILNNRHFTDEDHRRAQIVRDLIVQNKLTKYNTEPTKVPLWRQTTRPVILVPGQVEDDASIKYGAGEIRDNLALLRAARQARPDSFIVYKPHPDVLVRNRSGQIHRHDAMQYADTIETEVSIVSCIDTCDELHTMTSQSGFDALIRDKAVVVYGRPFYAGWGLTQDQIPVPRRDRSISLDDLIAGALLHYPVYWDWQLNGYTTCEAAIRQIINIRDNLAASSGLSSVRKTYLQRQLYKLRLWAKVGFLITR